MNEESYSISSLAVFCEPNKTKTVCEKIENMQECEIYYKDASGKIIVVVESSNVEGCAGVFKRIEAIPQVISAQMIYVSEEGNVQETSSVPKVLENELLKAEDIVYNGDVQQKIDNM